MKIGICAFLFVFISTKTLAQNHILIKRKLNIEFSLYSHWSKCNLEHLSGVNIAEPHISINAGNMLRFIYEFSNKQALIAGFNYYRNTSSINYTLDKTNYNISYTIYGPTEFTAHVISFPLSYSHQLQLAPKLFMYAEIGGYFTLPIITNNVSSGLTVINDSGRIQLLSAEYYSGKYTGGILIAWGLKTKLKKNEIKVSVIANMSVKKSIIGNYTFFPNSAEFTSKGNIRTGYGYVALGLSYVFSHKKRYE